MALRMTGGAQPPSIPNEMLVLMGVSAAGYVGGKAVRDAGPVIKSVVWTPAGVRLIGAHFAKKGKVWINGAEQTTGVTYSDLEPGNPDFAGTIDVALTAPHSAEQIK